MDQWLRQGPQRRVIHRLKEHLRQTHWQHTYPQALRISFLMLPDLWYLKEEWQVMFELQCNLFWLKTQYMRSQQLSLYIQTLRHV